MNQHIDQTPLRYQKYPQIIIALSLLFLTTAICTVKAHSQVKGKPGIFYAITRKGSTDTSYLFGTYHLVKSSYLTGLPHVKKALEKTHGIITEIVMDSTKLQQAQAMALLKGKTLSSMLNKPFSDSLENELKQSLGVGLAQLDQLKPVNVTLTLSMVYLIKNNKQKLDGYTGKPLDIYFVDLGKSDHKTVTPLETIEEQMDLLFNRSADEQQIKELRAFIHHKQEMISLGDEMMADWFNNDLAQMNTLYKQSVTLSGEADYLIKDRNIKWMKVLPGLLRKKTQFIGVGALHLAGDNGLIALLQQQGFTVTPLDL